MYILDYTIMIFYDRINLLEMPELAVISQTQSAMC